MNDSDDEPLSEHVRKATQAWREPNDPGEVQQTRVLEATRTPFGGLMWCVLCGFLFDDDEAHER